MGLRSRSLGQAENTWRSAGQSRYREAAGRARKAPRASRCCGIRPRPIEGAWGGSTPPEPGASTFAPPCQIRASSMSLELRFSLEGEELGGIVRRSTNRADHE